jgi:hypothetical protein
MRTPPTSPRCSLTCSMENRVSGVLGPILPATQSPLPEAHILWIWRIGVPLLWGSGILHTFSISRLGRLGGRGETALAGWKRRSQSSPSLPTAGSRLGAHPLSTGRRGRKSPAPPITTSPARTPPDSLHAVTPTDPRSVGRRWGHWHPSHRNRHQTHPAQILAGARPAAPQPGGQHGAQLGHKLNPPRRPEGSRSTGIIGQTYKVRGTPENTPNFQKRGPYPHTIRTESLVQNR